MRLGRVEGEPFKVNVPILELQEDESFKIAQIESWQRFRKFVQSRMTPIPGGLHSTTGGFRMRWFKEFGDPRVYDNTTGELVPPEKVESWKDTGKPMPEILRANEVVHFKLYSCRSPYGLPRYIGNLLSIFGLRASEEINYVTFRNNNIPSMVVLVSNGQLTHGSIERIESFVESAIQGSDNYSKFLLLEAEGVLEGEDAGQIKLEIKPLVSEQHKDALFQNYAKNNQDNIRRAFRLPPIFVGRTDDYSRTTADTSRRLADEQVFAPERDEFDNFINRRLFPAMDIVYHRFKSNTPNTTDNAQLVKILSDAEKTGGMTPRIARMVLTDILGRELPDFATDDRFDPDMPFSLLMAEAVKNKADPAEPGQQVTALKRLLDEAGGDDEATLQEILMPHLVKMRKRLERELETRIGELADDGSL
jgi:capsid portal protein